VEPLLYGTESGVITCRTPSGTLLASAYHGRDGWQVTRLTGGRTHLVYVASAADARVVLDAIGGTS
jgi:hypothetical protein